jgi:hypothetical protein
MGRKSKQKRNMTGLKNHKPVNRSSKSPSPIPQPIPEPNRYSLDWPSELPSSDCDSDHNSDDEWDTGLYTEDGLKFVASLENDSEQEIEGEDDYSLEAVFLDDEVLLENLLTQVDNIKCLSDDKEWVPNRVWYKRELRKQEKKGVLPFMRSRVLGD